MTEREQLTTKREECSELKEVVRELVEENQVLKFKLFRLMKQAVRFCAQCGNRLTKAGEVCRMCDPRLTEERRRRHAKSQANVRAKKKLQQDQLADQPLQERVESTEAFGVMSPLPVEIYP